MKWFNGNVLNLKDEIISVDGYDLTVSGELFITTLEDGEIDWGGRVSYDQSITQQQFELLRKKLFQLYQTTTARN